MRPTTDRRWQRSVALGERDGADSLAHEADAEVLEPECLVLADEVSRRRESGHLGKRVADLLVGGDELVDCRGIAGRNRVLLDEVSLLDDGVGMLRRRSARGRPSA